MARKKNNNLSKPRGTIVEEIMGYSPTATVGIAAAACLAAATYYPKESRASEAPTAPSAENIYVDKFPPRHAEILKDSGWQERYETENKSPDTGHSRN